MNIEKWKEDTERERVNKDVFFKGFQSPISFADQESFAGLDYYDPDPTYRFELPILEDPDKENIQIEDTKGK